MNIPMSLRCGCDPDNHKDCQVVYQRTLRQKALEALTVPEEQAEIKLVSLKVSYSLESRIMAAQCRGRKIIFAFFQNDFNGGKIPYWHVTAPYHRCYKSTLSMEGLRAWKVL